MRQVPALTRLLGDEHAWVQVRAAIALRSIGAPARGALPVLVALVQDDHEWVRTEALATVAQHATARQALMTLGADVPEAEQRDGTFLTKERQAIAAQLSTTTPRRRDGGIDRINE